MAITGLSGHPGYKILIIKQGDFQKKTSALCFKFKKKNVKQEKNKDFLLYLLSCSSSFLVEGKHNKKVKIQVISVVFCLVAALSTSAKREFSSNMRNVQFIFGIE